MYNRNVQISIININNNYERTNNMNVQRVKSINSKHFLNNLDIFMSNLDI